MITFFGMLILSPHTNECQDLFMKRQRPLPKLFVWGGGAVTLIRIVGHSLPLNRSKSIFRGATWKLVLTEIAAEGRIQQPEQRTELDQLSLHPLHLLLKVLVLQRMTKTPPQSEPGSSSASRRQLTMCSMKQTKHQKASTSFSMTKTMGDRRSLMPCT